ncbi:MAG: Gfo/Idh/MocA family oxidoreductase [Chloroflexi bacterium]|nr:Gfo/Idh/MocA family oxidoreductase [Chloroflexota bacterium]
MKKLHFGIVGVGNIASLHALAIQALPEAELVAVATRNADRGRAFAEKFGGFWQADYAELLQRPDVDVVAICTPHDLHAPMTIAAAQAGKHVLCEKPMARTTAECDAMIEACDRGGVTLGVVFQSRFEALSLQLKRLIDEGTLGRIVWNSANTIWYRSDDYYRSGPWRGTWEHEGGGVLINQAIHAIDLMLWLTGMPDRITAQTRTLNHAIEVEDGALAILEYADNRLGLIQATTAAYPGYAERIEVYGTRGSAIYHKGEGRLEWHLLDPREDHVQEANVSSGATNPMDISVAGHAAVFQDFTEAIRQGRRPLIDGHEGRRSVQLVEAIYRSALSGGAISLSLKAL